MDDLDQLRTGKLGVLLEIDYRRPRGYVLSNPQALHHLNPLQTEDLELLAELANWAAQLTYEQLPTNFAQLLQHLARHLGTRLPNSPTTLLLDRPASLDGRQHIGPLHAAVLARQVVRLDYRPYEEPPSTPTCSPYLLKEYNRRWFLVAYHHEEQRIWTYPLDRIRAVTDLRLTPYYEDPRITAEDWLRPLVGVIRPPGAEPVDVHLRTTALQACYLRTKPLHGSQEEVTPAGAERPEFRLHLIPNPELEMQLLSLGEAVEVIAPATFRDRLRGRLQAALTAYSEAE